MKLILNLNVYTFINKKGTILKELVIDQVAVLIGKAINIKIKNLIIDMRVLIIETNIELL